MSSESSDDQLEFDQPLAPAVTVTVPKSKPQKAKKPLTPAQLANLEKMRQKKAANKKGATQDVPQEEVKEVKEDPKPKKKEKSFKEDPPIFDIDKVFGVSDNTALMLNNLNNHVQYLTGKLKKVSKRQKEELVRKEQKKIQKEAQPQYQVNKAPEQFSDLAQHIMNSRW